jgi:hypothetical protein
MSVPPLIAGESTVKFAAVNTLLTVYGDMQMVNSNSILNVSAASTFNTMTVSNLVVTNSTTTTLAVTNMAVTNSSVTTLNATGATMTTLAVVGGSASSGIRVKEGGAGAKQGVVALTSGSATVANTSVTASSRIMLTAQNLSASGTNGALCVSSRSAGVNFVILSSQPADSSTVAYEIFEAA